MRKVSTTEKLTRPPRHALIAEVARELAIEGPATMPALADAFAGLVARVTLRRAIRHLRAGTVPFERVRIVGSQPPAGRGAHMPVYAIEPGPDRGYKRKSRRESDARHKYLYGAVKERRQQARRYGMTASPFDGLMK